MSLLPPGSSQLERNLENATSRMANIPVPIRDLWNPDTCPENLLPWLAWSLGLDAWKSYWHVSIKRAMLKEAITIKRKKGTAKSVRDVVAAFGSAVVMKECWQSTPPGAPHNFSVVIDVASMGGHPVTAEFQQDIIDEIARTKPVRSRFNLITGVTCNAEIRLAAVAHAVIYRRLELTDQ
uniref:phage tail protein I n=1 Tax=Cellvibrio fontiphilus TaxID=1815559 RepID=UPI002B4BDF0D|nr:phage tail protein I [Cellvibrio fontiphilus]